MIRRTGAFFALLCSFTLSSACGGCEDPPPIDETFDGNVVIGDATPPPDGTGFDSGEEDEAGVEDSGDAGDTGDSGSIGDDAESADGADDGGLADAGLDCVPEIARTISATTAVAEAETLDQLFVEITGTATAAALVCTACADAGPCSCTCTAPVAIDGLVVLEESPCFASPGCSGNECTQVCRPPVLGAQQRFRGRLNVRNSGPEKSVALELFSVSP